MVCIARSGSPACGALNATSNAPHPTPGVACSPPLALSLWCDGGINRLKNGAGWSRAHTDELFAKACCICCIAVARSGTGTLLQTRGYVVSVSLWRTLNDIPGKLGAHFRKAEGVSGKRACQLGQDCAGGWQLRGGGRPRSARADCIVWRRARGRPCGTSITTTTRRPTIEVTFTTSQVC